MNSSLLAVVELPGEERDSLVRQLEAMGYRLAGAAASLPAAESLVPAQRPEIVLVRLGLARATEDGLARVRRLWDQHHLPVVLFGLPGEIPTAEELTHSLASGWLPLPLEVATTRNVLTLAATLTMRLKGVCSAAAGCPPQSCFQRLLAGGPVGMLVVDVAERRVLQGNTRMAEALGCAPAVLTGLAIGDIHPAEARTLLDAELECMARGQRSFTTVLEVHRRDGSRFVAEVNASRVDWAQRCCAVMLYTDVTEQRRTELALSESERRMDLALGAASMGTWDQDLRTGQLVWSEAHERLWGYAPRTFPGTLEAFTSRVHPEDLAELRKAGEAAAQERRAFRKEVRVIWPDGSVHWAAIQGCHLFDEGGLRIRSTGVTYDVTEARSIHAALEESRTHLEAALASMTDGVAIADASGRLTHFNDAFLAFHRLGSRDRFPTTVAEAARQLRARLPDGTEVEPDQWGLPRALRGESEANVEVQLEHRETGESWMGSYSFAPIRQTNGAVVGAVVTVRNITLQKQAERELRASEERLNLVLERSQTGVWELDLDSRVAQCTTTHARIFGYDAPTPGWTYGLFLAHVLPEDRTEADRQTTEALAAGRDWHFECRIRRRDGEVRWIAVAGGPLPSAGGKPTRAAGIVVDITKRKLSEEALQRSEARYRALVETTFDWVWEMDAVGHYTYASPKVRDLLGYEPEEILGRTPFDLMPEAEARRISGIFAAIAADRRPFSGLENVNLHKDGHLVVLESSGVPILGPNGDCLGYRGMDRDITERKRAAEELQFRNSLLSTQLEASQDGILVVDDGERVLSYNRRFFELWGIPEELMRRDSDQPALDYVTSQMADPLAFRRRVEELYRDHDATGHDEILMKDGRCFERYTAPMHAAGRRYLGRAWFFRDISERRRMEAALRQLNEQLEQRVAERTADLSREINERKQAELQLRTFWSVVEQSPAVVVITNTAGTIEYVNPRFEAQTGFSAAEATGQNPRVLRSGVHSHSFYRRLWETIRSGQVWRGEICNRRKDGTLFWESTSIAPIRDVEGKVCRYVAIKEDITDRRRVAEELRRALEAADTANQAKSRFLANMSHEIRTPMNAILGFTQLMQREPALTPRQRQHLQTITRSGEHLLRLISDILDMSKIEAGRTHVVPSDFDFRALLTDLEAIFRFRAEEKQLVFNLEMASEVPAWLHTDAAKVRQVLSNILSNAIKFTSRGGLRVGATLGMPADLAADPGEVELAVTVSDTGMGIAPEEQHRVFEPFEQTRSGATHGGTGLGMAISRALARLLGGDLTLTSKPGQGSTFRFTFRARRAVPPPDAPAPDRTARRVIGLKPDRPPPAILVVDDTKSNREVLCDLLGTVGFRVRECADGAEAVGLCAVDTPDLVLMDCQMPGLDGMAATRTIRLDPRGSKLRILLISATVLGPHVEQWQATGADGFIAKPFREEDLLARIGQLLGIEYLYQTLPATPVALPADEVRTAASRLPADLRDALLHAAIAGDAASLRTLIGERVADADADLAAALGGWVANYELDAIVKALQADPV